jgi:hypothetical protein
VRKVNLNVIALSTVALMCGAAPGLAGPVIYASSDPVSSSGTELYVIDPIAATISVVKGVGIGNAGTGAYGGSYGNAGHGSGTTHGANDFGAPPGLDVAGATGGLGAGGLVAVSMRSTNEPTEATDASLATELIGSLATQLIDVVPQRSMTVMSDVLQSDRLRANGAKFAGTSGPGPESNARPTGGCVGDCVGSLTPMLVNCTENCGDDPPGVAGGGTLQIAAVPEPGLLALLGVGFAALGGVRRRGSL